MKNKKQVSNRTDRQRRPVASQPDGHSAPLWSAVAVSDQSSPSGGSCSSSSSSPSSDSGGSCGGE